MKIYLDNCCYNRPYDGQENPSVYLEAQAKMVVQDLIRNGELDLVTSSVLDFEISRSPYDSRRSAISEFIENYGMEKVKVDASTEIKEIAEEVMATGVKFYDAYHVACAIYSGCDYLLSTDRRLLKYTTNRIIMINPVDFIKILE